MRLNRYPMKDALNRFLVPALLAMAVVIVALNAWVAFRSLDVLLAQEDWVQHTWKVINQTEIIMGSVRDAENGERGFLITDDDEYLAPYTRVLELLPGQLDRLQQLTVDDSSQQHRIVELRAIITERMSLLQQGINLRRNGRSDSLHALVITGTGNMQMNRLRTLTEEMDKEEQRLLDMRVVEAKASAMRTRETLAVASAIDLLLIILMFRYFARERGMRLASEESAARLAVATDEVRALNATLEERVRARTEELENTNHELEAFSYSVSHDLRAPLRTIDGFSLALEEDYVHALDDTGRDYIHRVRAGVQRMGELIDALLQLSRITRATLTREHIDLTALASKVARDLQEQNPGRTIAFHLQNR
ncbi:MAG TPA: CHASE3 domain-containing protein, partial [Granulicella sp.]